MNAGLSSKEEEWGTPILVGSSQHVLRLWEGEKKERHDGEFHRSFGRCTGAQLAKGMRNAEYAPTSFLTTELPLARSRCQERIQNIGV